MLNEIVNIYLGDALWAIMIYLGIAFFFSKLTSNKVAFFSLIFCYCIETSQLYHGYFIDAIRSTMIGSLVLGSGFLWSDILAYAIGIFLAYAIEISVIEIK